MKADNRQGILFNAIKGKARAALHYLDVSKILEYEIEPPPQATLSMSYMIDGETWDFLSKLDNDKEPATLINALKEIAEQLFMYHARLWKEKNKNINVRLLSSAIQSNPITNSKNSSKKNHSRIDDYYSITITVIVPTEYQASDLILGMIEKLIKDKYNLTAKIKKPLHTLTEKQKEPLRKWFKYQDQILKELQINHFIGLKEKATEGFITPLVTIDKIKSYLKRRAHKEPTLIKCKHCQNPAYVLNPAQEFCFNPSCRVLAVRKK